MLEEGVGDHGYERVTMQTLPGSNATAKRWRRHSAGANILASSPGPSTQRRKFV